MPRVLHKALLLGALTVIAPGLSAQQARATISGIDGELLDNARALLSIRVAINAGERQAFMLERLHLRAPDELRTALQPWGYYRPEIEGEFEVDDNGNVRATYRVTPGPRTKIGDVDIRFTGDGADDAVMLARAKQVPLRTGEFLRHSRYTEVKDSLLQLAFSRGYFDVGFERARIRVQPEEDRADITLVLATGIRYRVGEIRIDQDILDDDVIRRYVPIHEGGIFAPRDLLDTQFTLMELGYFSRVDIEPLREDASDGRMPVRIKPEYLAAQRYSTGIGYGTDTGARLSLKSELRRINRRGHWIDSDIRLAERGSNLGASYNIPLGDIPGERLSFTSTYTDERFDDGNSQRLGVGASLSRQPGSWKRRVYLDYSTEAFEVGDLNRRSNLLVPGVSFERREVDDEIYTREGWSVFWDIHGASEAVLSTTTFTQTRVNLRGILAVGDNGRLLSRFEYGASFVDDFDDLPLSERFYAGGDQSVRGYAYKSLGSQDANGNVIGGEFMTAMSIEYEHLFWGNLGGAAFVDAGGAGGNSFPDLSRAVGVGLRYRAPIGSVRVDFAHPLDDQSRSFRLHIGIGVGL